MSQVSDAFTQAVSRTIYREMLAYDEGRIADRADCYAPDAILTASLGHRAEGRDQIRRMFESRRDYHGEREQQLRHFVTNVLVQEHSDSEAQVVSYMLTIISGLEGQPTVTAGVYRDVFVALDGEWLIKRRHVEFDGNGGRDRLTELNLEEG